jgi:2-dehydro-3-deoxyphosphogluconate aldolase / (4S)-4-hydroxy-2-oxoglutarate aldolase
MNKNMLVPKMLENKLVAVIRTDSPHVKEIVEHIIQGGVKVIEITLTMENSLELIKNLQAEYKNSDVLIGAGTVLDPVSARLAINCGAKFIVAPVLDNAVAEICNLYDVLYIPGISNPNDIHRALKLGLHILKLFPASAFSPSIIKDFHGPFPQADFMISGKVNEETIGLWMKAGARVVCVGSAFTNAEKNGYDAIEAVSRKFVTLVKMNENKGGTSL